MSPLNASPGGSLSGVVKLTGAAAPSAKTRASYPAPATAPGSVAGSTRIFGHGFSEIVRTYDFEVVHEFAASTTLIITGNEPMTSGMPVMDAPRKLRPE